jgi:outer membrane lipoprotein LolB
MLGMIFSGFARLFDSKPWLIAAVFITSLTACAPLSQVPGPVGTALTGSHPPLGPPLASFVADGRLALYQGSRQDHVRFRWQHSAIEDAVLFLSPLGQGVAEIRRDANGIELMQPNRPAMKADSLPALAQQMFGTPLPLDSLVDWLRGARPEWVADVDGWHIEVLDATVQPPGASLAPYAEGASFAPSRQRRLLRKMRVTREDVVLQVIIDSWDGLDEQNARDK